MTIKVYPSHLEGEPIETHEWTGTLAGFFASKEIDWDREIQPICVTVNGEALPTAAWSSRHLAATDAVDICLLTQKGGVFKGLGNIIGGVLGFAFGWLMPSHKGADYQSPEQGRQLETAQAKANQAKLNSVVPELAGRFKRYPDYLTPPRRFFTNKREQRVEFHACIGPGYYEVHPDDVKIGDTPFSALGDDASFQVFSPGLSLIGLSTHEHWHTADEVGGTASGTAGLELSTEIGNRDNNDPSSYLFNNRTITKNNGEFPPGWGVGTRVTVSYPRTYQVEQEGGRNTFTGFFGHTDLTANFFGSEWTLTTLENLGSGRRKIAFYKEVWEDPGGDGGNPVQTTVWLNNQTPGNRTYTFQPEQEWAVQENLGSQLVLQNTGGRYFESGATLTTRITFKGGEVYGEWTSEFVVTPANELTNALELDFFFPSGLAYITDSGELQNRSVTVEYQYRDVNGGGRTTVRKTYTDRTLDQIGYTERITVPSMRAAVRVRRVGAEATSTQIHDTLHWYGLKCRLRTRTSYPNWTTIAVHLRSGGRLAAQSENQINVVATRILPTLQADGSWSDAQPTRDISAFVRHVAHSIGYSDDNLDMEELQRLHAIWTSRGETFDYVVDLTTVKDALNVALGAGMAELTVADGRIRPVRDGPRTQFEQSYSPHNMTDPLRRTFRAKRHDDNDGVEVEYLDNETFSSETIICVLPGSPGVKLEKMKLSFGATKTQAWRIGMRRARELEYQRWEYSFGTEMDAFNSEYGGYVALFDDIPGYGQSALLRHISSVSGGALLQLTEPLDWEEGKEHVVAYRKPDGTLAGPWPALEGPDEYSVVADIPSSQRPIVSLKLELPHVYFGTAERWTFPAIIRQVDPRGMEAASVTAVNYDPRLYEDDDNEPPA